MHDSHSLMGKYTTHGRISYISMFTKRIYNVRVSHFQESIMQQASFASVLRKWTEGRLTIVTFNS